MTNLCIDVGNTSVKFGVFSNGVPVEKAIDPSVMAIEELISRHGVERCIMATVKEAASQVKKRIPKHIPVLLFDHNTPLPFESLYKTPATLGADRKAAVAGALMLHPGKSVLVIDTGSCITYDYVTPQGRYLGGGISPGVYMRVKALHNFTARLPLVELGPEAPALIGGSTDECIKSGVWNGVTSEITGIIARYQQLDPSVTILICGGDAQKLSVNLPAQTIFADYLVLSGLNSILEYNVQLL